MASPYSSAVFVIVPINDVMATVFDGPVAAVGGEHALRVSLFRWTAGDTIGDFTGVFIGLLICGLALDEKGLSDVRKAQIVVEFGCSPDFSDFYPAVIRRVALDKIRILPVLEIQCDVFKEPGLVVLDGEMVVSFTVPDQIHGDLALSQQSIGGDFLALNIDGVKEGACGLDFVGTLNLLVLYGQGTYFFWV